MQRGFTKLGRRSVQHLLMTNYRHAHSVDDGARRAGVGRGRGGCWDTEGLPDGSSGACHDCAEFGRDLMVAVRPRSLLVGDVVGFLICRPRASRQLVDTLAADLGGEGGVVGDVPTEDGRWEGGWTPRHSAMYLMGGVPHQKGRPGTRYISGPPSPPYGPY